MTVQEFYEVCECKSQLRVLSGYNGKVLCYDFDPKKHIEIGKRELSCFWADIKVTNSVFGNYARPYICCYVNGAEEYRKEHKE